MLSFPERPAEGSLGEISYYFAVGGSNHSASG